MCQFQTQYNSLVNTHSKENHNCIGESLFDGCSSFEKFTFPPSIELIEAYAFKGFKSLSKIVIPNSVYSIGKYAFFSQNTW